MLAKHFEKAYTSYMIKSNYPLESVPNRLGYYFYSKGKQGTIKKFIAFQPIEPFRYNLVFGDVIDGVYEHDVVSNNQDLYKVISTVVFAIHVFFFNFPLANVEIEAVDKKRLRLYNAIFSRKYNEIKEDFYVYGYLEGKIEPYSPNTFYEKFKISLKKI